MDIKTAQACAAQSPQAAALTYRYQQQSCSPISAQKEQLAQKQAICQKSQAEKIPIANYLKLEKCSQMKHSLVRHADRLCISQIQIVQCGGVCSPRSMIRRSVPFTCLPANRDRVSQLYIEKVKRGDILPELKNMEQSFSAEMQVPASCSQPNL